MNWLSVLITLLSSLASSPTVHWSGVLEDLDRDRAEAFAAGDPSMLDRVYAPGSASAQVDAAAIRAYAKRGGRVAGADLTLLSCRVRYSSRRRVDLVVLDRLAAAKLVWADGTSRTLPRDLPTKHHITLVRTSGGWRIG
ncbi:MAG: hypothetical protein QOJ72_2803 [Nocardioidaceae bacterium]|jgi:hypothetical protein|nr:hypothetical protein [Nocardioidaceae bacterium]